MKPLGKFVRRGSQRFVLVANLLLFLFLVSPTRAAFFQGNGQRTHLLGDAERGSDVIEELVFGKPITASLAGGQRHSYEIALIAGQYAATTVYPEGIAIAVVLLGPDGQQIEQIESQPNGQQPVEILVLATTVGKYRFQVSALRKDAPAGRYQISLKTLRLAGHRDRDRVIAQKHLLQGKQLFKQGSDESLHKAILSYEDALRLYLPAGDRREAADATRDIAEIYFRLGEPRKALIQFNRALTLQRLVRDRWGEAATLNDIGVVYAGLGQKQIALDYYNRSLPLRRSVADSSGEGTTISNMGAAYSALGDKRKALEFYEQALPLRQAALDRRGEASTLNNIGGVYYSLEEKLKAIDYYARALEIFRADAYAFGEATSLSNLGRVYESLGDHQKAIENYNRALDLKKAVGDRRGEAATVHNLGDVYFQLNNLDKALDFNLRALSVMREVGDQNAESSILYSVARTERRQENLLDALHSIEGALSTIEILRARIANPESRASYFAMMQEQYDFYIDLLMQLHRLHPADGYDAKALEANERARARSLLEMLNEAHAEIRRGVDPRLLEQERTLQELIDAKAQHQVQLMNGKHTEEQATVVKKELEELLTEYEQIEGRIRATSARYAALAQPRPLSAKQIQEQVLDADTLLLEYALGEERSYLWAVTPSAIKSIELPKREIIEGAASRLHKFVTEDGPYEESAMTLSDMLLHPVAKLLAGKRLLVVGNGALQYVPFVALPEPSKDGSSTELASPLTLRHEIISMPSASTVAAMRQEPVDRPRSRKLLAVLADPVYEKDDLRFNKRQSPLSKPTNPTGLLVDQTKESRRDCELGFRRLSNSREEGQVLRTLVPQHLIKEAYDFSASRQLMTSPELRQYRIVHVAVHACVNEEHPELSAIVLSLFDPEGRAIDGYLRLHDIYNLNLPAELLVLSGCETGLGRNISGEGLVGLTRGFMYAGAERVVASLWSISDRGTVEVMKLFYEGMLRDHLRPAAALRAAQAEMWRRKRPPYYWAAFVMQGEWK